MLGIAKERRLFLKESNIVRRTTALREYVEEHGSYFLGKRIVDIVISSLIIVFLLSWLLPVLAILMAEGDQNWRWRWQFGR